MALERRSCGHGLLYRWSAVFWVPYSSNSPCTRKQHCDQLEMLSTQKIQALYLSVHCFVHMPFQAATFSGRKVSDGVGQYSLKAAANFYWPCDKQCLMLCYRLLVYVEVRDFVLYSAGRRRTHSERLAVCQFQKHCMQATLQGQEMMQNRTDFSYSS